ncbi:MAG: cyclic-di-AMP receptor [Anaerolineae bacterium]
MKLVVSIVHCDDAGQLTQALTKKGHRATVISTTGGFLREGNATVLVGTEAEKVEEVLGIVKEQCCARTQYVNPLPPIAEPGELYMAQPVEVEVGGAIVFVLDVERFERF